MNKQQKPEVIQVRNAHVHDEMRKIYAKLEDAKNLGYKAGDFSYNTGRLRRPENRGLPFKSAA